MAFFSWHFTKSEYKVTVTTGNTELPKDAFVVSGFDVSGKILNDGETIQNIEFVLFNSKNVSVSSALVTFSLQWPFGFNYIIFLIPQIAKAGDHQMQYRKFTTTFIWEQ